MSTLKGRACKAYRNTGTEATPVWTEIDIIKDAKYGLTGNEADITVRRHGGTSRVETTHNEVGWEFDLRVPVDKLSSADYVALRDAAADQTPIELAFTNGPIATAGNEIFRCVSVVTSFGDEQPLKDAVKISVAGKATDSTNEPGFTEAS